MCEKALAEYLETKRLAFPRFYFVSSADLLNILSKGNQPTEVRHACYSLVCSIHLATCLRRPIRYICRSTQSIILQPSLTENSLFTQVACHLAKLFDSMAQLKFLEEDGQPTKEAIGMFSKDGEYVAFDKPCMCIGQVSSLCMCVCAYF